MTSSDLKLLRDYIKTQNTYFDTGYYYAYKEGDNIYAKDDAGNRVAPLTDSKGNFFYIRIDGDMRMAQSIEMDNCGLVAYNDTIRAQIVACVRNADEWLLLNNIRSTVIGYKGLISVNIGAILLRESVIRSEIGDNEKALQNLSNQTLVRVTLDIQKQFKPANCIVDVCTC